MFIRYTIMVRMGIDMLEGWPTTDRSGSTVSGSAWGRSGGAGLRGRAADPEGGFAGGRGDIPAIIADTAYGTLRAARAARMAAEAIPDLAGLRARVEDELDIDPLDFACLRDPEDVFMVIVSADSNVRAVHSTSCAGRSRGRGRAASRWWSSRAPGTSSPPAASGTTSTGWPGSSAARG